MTPEQIADVVWHLRDLLAGSPFTTRDVTHGPRDLTIAVIFTEPTEPRHEPRPKREA